jgi:hypothetical protein
MNDVGHCHAGPRPIQDDTGGSVRCPRRLIRSPNLVDGLAALYESVCLGRVSEACAIGMPFRADLLGRDRTGCLAPVKLP